MIRASLILLIACFFISCDSKNKIPAGVLKPDKMRAVLWDVIRVEAFTTGFIKKEAAMNVDVQNATLQQKVFAVHKVSKETFYKSYVFYKSNRQLFKPILDSLISAANRQRPTNIKISPIQLNKDE